MYTRCWNQLTSITATWNPRYINAELRPAVRSATYLHCAASAKVFVGSPVTLCDRRLLAMCGGGTLSRHTCLDRREMTEPELPNAADHSLVRGTSRTIESDHTRV
jgi:hypothetical protein